MKLLTEKLEGAALDWAVAECEGLKVRIPAWAETPYVVVLSPRGEIIYSPSSSWALVGPIIEREKLAVVCRAGGYWLAYTFDGAEFEGTGPTPLLAAMRCYVMSKLGDEVDVPDELVGG